MRKLRSLLLLLAVAGAAPCCFGETLSLHDLEIDRTSCRRFWAHPVPPAADRCRLRAHAGVAPASRPYPLGSRSGLEAPQATLSEFCEPIRFCQLPKGKRGRLPSCGTAPQQQLPVCR